MKPMKVEMSPAAIEEMMKDNVRMRNALWTIIEKLPHSDEIHQIAARGLDIAVEDPL